MNDNVAGRWRVVEPSGVEHDVDVDFSGANWRARSCETNEYRSWETARDAVVMLAARRSWPVREVLAPGELSRDALLAMLPDAHRRGAEAMRVAAMQAPRAVGKHVLPSFVRAATHDAIRDLPLPEYIPPTNV